MNQVRLLQREFLPTSSPGVVAFPGSPGRSSPPGFLFFYFYVVLLRIRGFCGFEFENSAQQQPVWSRVFVVFLYFEFISRLDALHSVLNSLYLHALPMSKLRQQNRFFFRGVMTPTLLPVRPGLHSTDVGLLGVCHCHCQRSRSVGDLWLVTKQRHDDEARGVAVAISASEVPGSNSVDGLCVVDHTVSCCNA